MLSNVIVIIVQKCILRQNFNLSLVLYVLVLNLFLIFHQTSGSSSYKIVLIRKWSGFVRSAALW